MQVVCSCNPVVGHFHPMLPLARALRDAGHTVTFMTGPDLSDAVHAEGFPIRVVGPRFEEMVTAAMTRAPELPLATARDQQRFGFERLFSAVRVESTLADAQRVVRELGPELVLNEPGDFVGPLVAAQRDIPSATVGVGLVALDEWLGLAARSVASFWTDSGLVAPADAGLYRRLYLNQWPVPLQRSSVHDLPWVEDVRPVAFGADTELPNDLDHLGRDRPLLYVTFGTVFGTEELVGTVLDGLAQADADVLVTVGPSVDTEPVARRHPHVTVRQFVPQAPVLARSRLAIIHGGAGSVIGPLCFGVPLLVIPVGADQEENAERVEPAGVGRCLLPSELTPESVRSTVADLLADDETTDGARALRARIDAMPSPDDVVPVLEALVG